MAGSKKGRDMADDPDYLKPKINDHWSPTTVKSAQPPSTPKRYQSQQAQETKSVIRRGGARGR